MYTVLMASVCVCAWGGGGGGVAWECDYELVQGLHVIL